ncbi:hypothetical protein WI460_12540 [Gemmatimonadota bacterium Y43]|uniref:hypothetical protein n=1 Tax=Gaopeijia maritima TaxID=3119007 RepID=UPI003268243C
MVLDRFGDELGGMQIALADLAANFTDRQPQGPQAYVSQMMIGHPELDRAVVATDAIVAAQAFRRAVMG